MKKYKLNNIILPIWLLMYIPQLWILTLPANFIIDSIVLVVAFAVLKVENRKDKYLKSIIKVWIFGFFADFIGAIVMITGTFGLFNGDDSKVGEALRWNPFDNGVALLWTVISIIVAAVCIYIFDRKFALAKTGLSERKKKEISIIMAIFTAPYVMALPTCLFVNH
ncbi:hypothetical protein [Eubacterium sp.]|uniref:hypothetical protein n=1 Tax=Eubacterium sp. TaxID=142586 RepID=UPI0025DE0BD2|nr:hypothetical protein [Eubacterium sp.]MCR5629946.1 hypothetical protein [Eubacterium sp.]